MPLSGYDLAQAMKPVWPKKEKKGVGGICMCPPMRITRDATDHCVGRRVRMGARERWWGEVELH